MKADHWHILGAGAIGSLCAAALCRTGHKVTLLLKNASALSQYQTAGGLRFEDIGGHQARLSVEAEVAGSGDDKDQAIRHLLLCTKAFDARKALETVAHHLAPDAVVLLMVNGMGVAESLEDLATFQLFCGTTTEGVHRRGPFDAIHAGRGRTLIGHTGMTSAPDWFTAWQASNLGAQWVGDIDAQLWLKLAINCAINPLTAVHACRNGDLSEANMIREVDGLVAEIGLVLTAEGHPSLAGELASRVFEVIRATADNRSSMLQDLSHDRRTEIDFITGYLLKRAAVHHLALPQNTQLFQQVKQLESIADA
ncbi:MAG: 2-dehydropantoate 2-reductase [Pseudomonadota bacterium]